jgi:hypothetical protein
MIAAMKLNFFRRKKPLFTKSQLQRILTPRPWIETQVQEALYKRNQEIGIDLPARNRNLVNR